MTIPFAVHIDGVHEEGKGSWVLDLSADGTKVLIVDDKTKGFDWHPMDKCTLVRMQTPEQPPLVVAVQAQQRPTIAVPGNGASRARRRHPEGG